MLRADYWLFEYISIPEVLRRAPVKYYRAFLHTETDDNDLTYFLLHQSVPSACQTCPMRRGWSQLVND